MSENKSIARVIIEHKERYKVAFEEEILDAEITGNLRYSAESSADFPVVGDYVIIQKFDDNFCIINDLVERKSWIRRKSVSSDREEQYIAANIDSAFIAQAVDRDFNIHRLDRYITALYDGNVNPIILLTKIDLIEQDDLDKIILEIEERHIGIPIIAISTLEKTGFEKLQELIKKEKSYCVLGSSGVGKSTLINALLADEHFDTKEISTSNSKGKHTTSHRELVTLKSGAYFIDTPGMREFGIVDADDGIDSTFSLIKELSNQCKFSDCSHENEPGCAVQQAISDGELDQDYLKQYGKLQRESLRFTQSKAEKRSKDKAFGKMIKQHVGAKKKLRGH